MIAPLPECYPESPAESALRSKLNEVIQAVNALTAAHSRVFGVYTLVADPERYEIDGNTIRSRRCGSKNDAGQPCNNVLGHTGEHEHWYAGGVVTWAYPEAGPSPEERTR